MTLAYFDASALVKLFLDEDGSDDAQELWNAADTVFASRVVDAEVPAALAAARRAHRLDDASHGAAAKAWASVFMSLRFVELTGAIARSSGEVAEEHALGALDAIHLASAMVLVEDGLVLATWDARLLEAARTAGIATLPAS